MYVVFMTVLHTHFYIVVDTQRGCHTFKKKMYNTEFNFANIMELCFGGSYVYLIYI